MPIQSRGVGRLVAGTVVSAALLGVLAPVLSASADVDARSSYDQERTSSRSVTLRVAHQVSNQRPVHVRVAVRPRSAFEPGRLRIRSEHRTLLSLRVAHPRDLRGRLQLPRLARTGTHRLQAVFTPSRGARLHSTPVDVVSRAGCAWRPSSCGFPDASNTGPAAGAHLRDVPGDITSGPGWHVDNRGWIEVGNGAVVDRIRTSLPLSISGTGVTVSNSEIVVAGNEFAVQLRHSEGVRVVRNIIRAPAQNATQRLGCAIKDMYGDIRDLAIVGNEIRNASTAIQVGSGRVEGNYLHHFGLRDGDHVNGFTSNGSTTPLVLRGNTILNEHAQTDAVSLFQDFGVEANRRITGNLLAGGGYVIYGGDGGQGQSHDIVITDNRISQVFYGRGGYYGPIAHFDHGGPGNVLSGNVWDETGRPVS